MNEKVPDRVWCRSYPTITEIQELIAVLPQCKLSEASVRVFRVLAGQPPDRRLAINLKSFLGLCMQHEIKNVLNEGLNDKERRALSELDASNLPVRLREVAHGLLNVHERWCMLKGLAKPFQEARAARMNYVQTKTGEPFLLDDILGNEKQ